MTGDATMLMWYYSLVEVDQVSDLWQELELAFELESDLWDIADWTRKWLVDFSAWKTQLVMLTSLITRVLLMWRWPVLEEKSDLKMLVLPFFSKLGWDSKLFLLLKLPPRKLEPWFVIWILSVYIYKSTIQPCMKYWCHMWTGATDCHFDNLDRLKKQVCRAVGLSLALCLESLVYYWNVDFKNWP